MINDEENNKTKKRILSYIVLLAVIPLVVISGAYIFKEKNYTYTAMAVTFISFIPFFLTFEKKKTGTKEIVLVAVMTSLSVAGRIAFFPVPNFKPVSALVIITGMYLGCEAGFVTGALSGLISNFYFGQGPWTPFQMLSWGLIGFVSGILRKPLKNNNVFLYAFGALTGLLYSFLMDIWTVLWADGSFNLSRYLAAVITAAPVTATYAMSNVFFLLVLAKPLGKVFLRLRLKYGIGLE